MFLVYRKLNKLIREELEANKSLWDEPVISDIDQNVDDFKKAIMKAINIVVLSNNNNSRYGTYSDEEIAAIVMDAARDFNKK